MNHHALGEGFHRDAGIDPGKEHLGKAADVAVHAVASGAQRPTLAEDVGAALARLDALDTSQRLLSKGIRNVDLRLSGQIIVGVAEVAADATDQSGLKVSQSD